jgi:putative oxidoreductase
MVLRGLTRYREVGLLLLRIGIGAAFVAHGWPKLQGGPGAWEGVGGMLNMPAPVVFGFIAAVAEFFGGILFALGLLFRPAAILLTLQMLAAMYWHLAFATGPAADYGTGWSHPLKMAIIFFAFILIGPGKYSIDRQ